MTEHLGHERNTPAGNETGNVRNGSRAEEGADRRHRAGRDRGARDRDGTFEPQIVKKRQRRLNGVDEIVLSLYAKVISSLN